MYAIILYCNTLTAGMCHLNRDQKWSNFPDDMHKSHIHDYHLNLAPMAILKEHEKARFLKSKLPCKLITYADAWLIKNLWIDVLLSSSQPIPLSRVSTNIKDEKDNQVCQVEKHPVCAKCFLVAYCMVLIHFHRRNPVDSDSINNLYGTMSNALEIWNILILLWTHQVIFIHKWTKRLWFIDHKRQSTRLNSWPGIQHKLNQPCWTFVTLERMNMVLHPQI